MLRHFASPKVGRITALCGLAGALPYVAACEVVPLAESTSAASTRHRSVVAQSIHGSVIDMPYLSDARSVSGWLPAPILLSSIRPIIARLPLATCLTNALSIVGCLV